MDHSRFLVCRPLFLRNSLLIGWVTATLTVSSRITRMTPGIPMLSDLTTDWSPWSPRNGYVATDFGMSLFHSTLGVGYVPRGLYPGKHQPFRRCMFPIYSLSVSLSNEFPARLAGKSCQGILEAPIRTLTPNCCIAGSWTMSPGTSKPRQNDGSRLNDSTLGGPLVSFYLVSSRGWFSASASSLSMYVL